MTVHDGSWSPDDEKQPIRGSQEARVEQGARVISSRNSVRIPSANARKDGRASSSGCNFCQLNFHCHFFNFFLSHPKIDYKLSLCITFSNTFDNLWKS